MSEIEKKLWRRVKLYLKVLHLVPFVKMVAVCNNLAFGRVDEKSDIDLFIVAKHGRLFLVRVMVTFLLQIMGVRRHGNKISGRFCLSFWVDDSALNLSSIALSQDIYLAFWVKTMKPVIDRGCFLRFWRENQWCDTYFEDLNLQPDFSHIIGEQFFLKAVRSFLNFVFRTGLGDFCELKLKNWQLRRAKQKMSLAGSEADLIVDEHILKFHNVDRRREYRGLWQRQYGEAKITSERFLALRF